MVEKTLPLVAPGAVLAGRYEIERRLGQGGMGVVFVANDRRLGRRVALKTVSAELAGSSDARHRLRAEAEAVASVDHSGIVTLFDVIDHGDDIVLVMELVNGVSLRERASAARLQLTEVATLVSSVASALSAAHARGLVHRDVKPDNIMIRADGRTALLDFGIAKALRRTAANGSVASAEYAVTRDGVTVGTPAYFSPEQATGDPITPACDQFALAVVAYELLTGSSPWPMTSVAELVTALLYKTAPPPSSRRLEIGAGVDAVIARAMSKAPQDRFPDIEGFADALSSALRASRDHADIPHASPALLETLPADRVDPARSAAAAHGAAFGRGHTQQLVPTPPSVEPHFKSPLGATPGEPPASVAIAASGGSARGTAGGRDGKVRPRVLKVGAAAAALALASAALGLLTRRSPPDAKVLAPTPSAVTSSFSMADIAASPTTNPEALAAFRQAMRRGAAGDYFGMRDQLEAAIAYDGKFSSARLQRVIVHLSQAGGLNESTRLDVATLKAGRGTLPPRDQELLDALSPAVTEPPNWREEVARLESFLVLRPCDGQGWDAIALAKTKLGDYQGAIRALEREAACDPTSVAAYYVWSQLVEDTVGDAATEAVLNECLLRDPSAVDCLARVAERLGTRGSAPRWRRWPAR